MSTGTVNPVKVIAAFIVLGVVVILGSRMVSRMPPDPFKDNEPREVVLEVEWEGPPRTQHIEWDVAGEHGTHTAHSTPLRTDSWTYITTAFEGDEAILSSVQTANGILHCAIYVDEVLMASDPTENQLGCHVQAVVP